MSTREAPLGHLTLKQVEKRFGGFVALHAVDLEVEDGEFLVLVGPSGCGKSTLLRIIAGLESVSSGEIMLDGESLKDVPPRDRDMAMVFQDYALYPQMSVAENLGFGLKMRGRPRDEIADRVAAVAEILELTPLLLRRPRALSGGQRQRVALGRAMIRSPEVFLLDEPLSNLDAKLRVGMRMEIRRIQKRVGTTSIYVTHDQVEAMTMADRIVVMKDGRIQQIGDPMEIYDRPANSFVGTFIGSPPMSLIEAAVDGGMLVFDDGVRVALPADRASAVASVGRVLVGLRAEHVEIVAPGKGGADFRSDIGLVENHGPESIAVAVLGGVDILARVPSGELVAGASDVGFRLRADRISLFDMDGGAALV